jgi:hypothetical protein
MAVLLISLIVSIFNPQVLESNLCYCMLSTKEFN